MSGKMETKLFKKGEEKGLNMEKGNKKRKQRIKSSCTGTNSL